MDENPGPSAPQRPLLEGNSDEENAVEDPGSTDPPQDAWLPFWDSFGPPASANRALLWDLMDILAKPKFREVFKLGFKAVVGNDWNDSGCCGMELKEKLNKNPKSKFSKKFNNDQKNLVLRENILEWDITLLNAAIQALVEASNSTWNPTNMAEIDVLKKLRNILGHTGGHHFKDDEFEPMYETFKNNVKSLGWTAEEVDAARKHLTMPKTLFACEAPTKLFYGRQDKLRECKDAITLCLHGKNAKDRIVAIHGFGGMGKTQLARSMGHILRSDGAAESELSFDIIFSFDAQTEGSLEKGFKDLVQRLRIPVNIPKSGKLTIDDINSIYVELGRYYKQKVLFIFDNAEQLNTQNGKFGLKAYLGPRNDCHGPVFLVTSRDPWHLWIDPSKCIKVDKLSPEDARSCLLGYMRIPEDKRESEDLKEPLESLVKLIGGHPLGLRLCGSAIENKVRRSKQDRYSWTHAIDDYQKLLKQQPLISEYSGEKEYKKQVKIICEDTLEKIRQESQGIGAASILGIIAYLSPDGMELGLVKCVHLNEIPDDYRARARWDDLPVEMREEMNILRDYSLIGLDNRHEHHTLVKIHRLVQECTRELILSTSERDPLQKIITFSDRYDLREEQIVFILNLYTTNPSELSPLDDESKWKLRSRIAYDEIYVKALNPALEDSARNEEEKYVVKVLLMQSEGHRKDVEFYIELHDVIRKLWFDYGYHSKAWFIESCSRLLDDAIDCFDDSPPLQDEKKKKLLELSGWVMQGYLQCEIMRDISSDLLRVANFVIANGGSIESTLLPKIFSISTTEEFWENYAHSQINNSREWLECLVSCPKTNLVTRSLHFFEESRLHYGFFCDWGDAFCGFLNDAAREPQLRCQLSKDRDGFVTSFWKMTEWIFGHVTRDNASHGYIIPLTLSAWCGLFSGDESLYELYHLKLDNLVAVWMKSSPQIDFYDYGFLNFTSLKNFPTYKHCSAETKRWIEEVYRLVPATGVRMGIGRV